MTEGTNTGGEGGITTPPANTGTSFGDTTPPMGAPPATGDNPSVGGADKPFTDSLPEAYRNDPTFKDYKDLDGLLKSHKELSGKLGQKVIERPGDGATEDQLKAYRAAIGVPESADEYKFDTNNLPEGIDKEGTETLLGLLAPVFQESNIPAQDAAKFVESYLTKIQPELEKSLEGKFADSSLSDDKFNELMKTVYGDKADEKIAKTGEQFKSRIPEEHKTLIDNAPNEALAAISLVIDSYEKDMQEAQEKYNALYKETHGEDAPLPADGGGQTGVNKDEARGKAKAAYEKMQTLDQTSPQYQEALKEYNKYSAVAYS